MAPPELVKEFLGYGLEIQPARNGFVVTRSDGAPRVVFTTPGELIDFLAAYARQWGEHLPNRPAK